MKTIKWILVLIILAALIGGGWYLFRQKYQNASQKYSRIPPNTCPSKFVKDEQGANQGYYLVNGKKYYSNDEDYSWIIANCPDSVKNNQ